MNVVPSAASSIGAPAAGIVPAAAPGAGPATAPSFADLLRTLAGQEAGGFAAIQAGSGLVATPGPAAARGQAADDETDAADTAAGADAAAIAGAFAVPVAFTAPLPVMPAPAADGASADGAVQGEVPTSYVSSGTVTAAPAAIVPAGRMPAGEAPAGANDTPSTGDVPAETTDVPGASVTTPPTTVPGAAAHVGAPAGRGPDDAIETPAMAGPGRRTQDGPVRQGRVEDRDARASSERALTPAFASAAAGETAAPETTDDQTANAAATLTRLLGDTSHDMSRVPGLPRALARVLEQGGASRDQAAASTGAPAASGSAAIDVAAIAALSGGAGAMTSGHGEADTSDGASGQAWSAAMTRTAPHPALAAALRAFQQAGTPVGDTASSAAPQGDGETRLPGVAARLAAAFGAGEPALAPAEGDRHAATMTTLLAPAFAAEPKALGELAAAIKADAAAPALLSHADAEAVHSQVVQSLRLQWAGGAGEATVRLRPEYLGDVTATIKVEQGAVTATLQADRPEVRRWMEANSQTLRDGLVEHGLKLDRLDVLAEAAKGGAAHDERQGRPRGRQPQPQPQPRPRRERQDEDAPAFAVNP